MMECFSLSSNLGKMIYNKLINIPVFCSKCWNNGWLGVAHVVCRCEGWELVRDVLLSMFSWVIPIGMGGLKV